MKAGIFTFHYAYNYGAVLQCMALYRTLQRMGVDVDVINYVPPQFAEYEHSLLRGWGVKKGLLLKNTPKKIIQARYGKAMRRVFDQFRAEQIGFSSFCQTPDEIAEVVKAYDLLITGSDQVWHFAQKPPFFLEWGVPFAGKKISYAPCCGSLDQPEDRKALAGRWISDFDFISVRNTFSRELVKEVSGRDAEIVADPTLLVDLSDLARRPVELKHEKYILMYMLGDEIQGGHQKVLNSIKERFGKLPVVAVVSSAHRPRRFPWADQVLYTAGPAEWLYLVSHAEFVYTDSFHGALFSIKAEVPFCVYYREAARAPRLLDLAERYQLNEFVAADASQAIDGIQNNPYNFSG
ncbi:MAG: polysaccharide pyruvyl transferase family protein, partial [Deltaproteobacteria bacterium]|nr:polysaccharide pyruvyl transferase family protein [Deltaproteobacteria bacterium]